MEQSLGVLKPFGRFLELGKRDFYLNRRIHLRPLRQNISYFAIDIDQLPIRRPDLARALLGRGVRGLGCGHDPAAGASDLLVCRARRCLPADAVVRAYRQARAACPRQCRACGCRRRPNWRCGATEPIWSPAASKGSALRRRAGWPRTAPARSRCSAAAAPRRREPRTGCRTAQRSAPRSASMPAMSPIRLRLPPCSTRSGRHAAAARHRARRLGDRRRARLRNRYGAMRARSCGQSSAARSRSTR